MLLPTPTLNVTATEMQNFLNLRSKLKPTPVTNTHNQPLRQSSKRHGRRNPKYYNDNMVNATMELINAVLDPETGKMQEYKTLIQGKNAPLWVEGNSKEIARLAQGSKSRNIIGTNQIFFKHHNEILPGIIYTSLK